MESSKQRLNLKNLRLTLSKYDAKYSKTSIIFDDDTSDEAEEEPHVLLPTQDSLDMLFHHHGHSTDTKQNLAETSQGETPNSTVVLQLEEQKNDHTAQSLSITSAASLRKDFSMLDTDTSSLASVETDSEIGFNNVHSVSSLAESVIPLEEEIKLESTITAAKTKSQTLPSLPTEIPVSFSEGNVKESKNSGDDVLSFAKDLSPLVTCINSVLDKSEVVSTPTSASSTNPKDISLNKSQNRSFSFKGTKSNQLSTFDLSSSERTSSRKKSGTLKRMMNKSTYCDFDTGKVSVAIQTSIVEDIETHGSTSVKLKHRSVATPVIKPLKLPSYVRGDCDNPPHSSLHDVNGWKGTLDDETQKLVSYHLNLVKEFLERQHRLYITNYKAVQLLERGYKENTRN